MKSASSSPRRRPHDTRWRVLAAATRLRPGDVVKFLAALVTLLIFVWNASMVSVLVTRQQPLDGGSGGMNRPMTNGQHLLRTEKDASPMPPTSAPVDLKRPWFLEPATYQQQSGCDFSEAVRLFEPRELAINCDNIHQLVLGDFVGQGFWRDVFKAEWQGREVAVKVVKEKLLDRTDIIPRHVEEAASTFSIRKAPNIVSLVGWCNTTVIVEYVPNKLEDLVFVSDEAISVGRALELAWDAAKGLEQLHSARGGPFAHTDIQTRQFLIDDSGRLKLNDFNRVKYTGQCLQPGKADLKCYNKVTTAKGKWRAPEEYLKGEIDEKVDIYSLSLVLWTLRSRSKPFPDQEREVIYEEVPKGLRPPVEAMGDYPQAMQDLIVRGWDTDPMKRPTAAEYAREIHEILKQYAGGGMS